MSMSAHGWSAANGVEWHMCIPLHALTRIQKYFRRRGYAADAGALSRAGKSRLVHFYPLPKYDRVCQTCGAAIYQGVMCAACWSKNPNNALIVKKEVEG